MVCVSLHFEILLHGPLRDNSKNFFAAKSCHNGLIKLALVLGCPCFAQKPEVAESNVLVICDLARIERRFDFSDAILKPILAAKSKPLLNLGKINTVVTPVRILVVLNPRAREYALDDPGDFRERVVKPVVPHVEDFLAYSAQRRFQKQDDCLSDVLDVNERAPLFTIKDRDSAILLCFCRQKVNNKVEPRTIREPKYSCEAHDHRMEVRGSALEQCLFGRYFCLSIQRDRLHFRIFIHQLISCPVNAAT